MDELEQLRAANQQLTDRIDNWEAHEITQNIRQNNQLVRKLEHELKVEREQNRLAKLLLGLMKDADIKAVIERRADREEIWDVLQTWEQGNDSTPPSADVIDSFAKV